MTKGGKQREGRKYYSSRHGKREFDLAALYRFLRNLYSYFSSKDYFKEKLGITVYHVPDSAIHMAAMALHFDLFPLDEWPEDQIKEESVFDAIEYLYQYGSKPGEMESFVTDNGLFGYDDYGSYDAKAGKEEYRGSVNEFLADFGPGYELSDVGTIERVGEYGLEHILNAKIIPYDSENVDKKVQDAIRKWKNRHCEMEDRKQAILDLAAVFEWLKDEGKLTKALSRKDESALFDIANKFALRHHNPQQKSDYDINIWYSWIFHFYLATYHAAIRLIKRMEARGKLEK